MMKKILILVCFGVSVSAHGYVARAPKPTVDKATPLEIVDYYCRTPQINLFLFAPDSGRIYKMILLGLMQTTSSSGSIQVAAYRFTDKDIMNGLVEAHKRGVSIEVIFDPGAMTNTYYSLALPLCDAGVPVRQYQTTGLLGVSERVKYQSILHQKTMIFRKTLSDQNNEGKDVVASGSLNFTTAGFYGNEEAVFVLDAPQAVGAFSDHFEKLRQRSYSVEPYRMTRQVSVQRTIMASALRFIKHL